MSSLSPIRTTATEVNATCQNPSLFQTPYVTRFSYRAYVKDNINKYNRTYDVTPSPFVPPLPSLEKRTQEEVDALIPAPESFAPTKEQVKKLWEAKALMLLGAPRKEFQKAASQDKTLEIAKQFGSMSLSSSSTAANASKNAKS